MAEKAEKKEKAPAKAKEPKAEKPAGEAKADKPKADKPAKAAEGKKGEKKDDKKAAPAPVAAAKPKKTEKKPQLTGADSMKQIKVACVVVLHFKPFALRSRSWLSTAALVRVAID